MGLDSSCHQSLLLYLEKLVYALLGNVQYLIERIAGESLPFRSTLHLYEFTRVCHYDVEVYLGLEVLLVAKVQQYVVADNADAGGGYCGLDGIGLDGLVLHQPLDCLIERDVCASNGGGSRATISLKNVAVHREGALAQLVQIDECSERSAYEPRAFGMIRNGTL